MCVTQHIEEEIDGRQIAAIVRWRPPRSFKLDSLFEALSLYPTT